MKHAFTIVAFVFALGACDSDTDEDPIDDGPGAEHCEPCAPEPLPECTDYCSR
jgi:hypothetical protein